MNYNKTNLVILNIYYINHEKFYLPSFYMKLILKIQIFSDLSKIDYYFGLTQKHGLPINLASHWRMHGQPLTSSPP